ncbi:MAG: hypothetical protein GY807_01530 [Gammaproteobacteria bacterium]|nr:hypothetical protein [Gammaproteobacteria bacterium]
MRIISVSVLAFYLLAVAPVQSGPDKTTEFFMNTPASLFDLGIFRLELDLQNKHYRFEGYWPGFKLIYPNIYYDWGNDKIVIEGRRFRATSQDQEKSEELCEKFFRDVRKAALVDPDTGNLVDQLSTSIFTDMFTHEGFSNEPTKNAAKDLDSKFRIVCIVGSDRYQAPLLSNTYLKEK